MTVAIAALGESGRGALERLEREVRSAWAPAAVTAVDIGEDRAALARAIRRWCDRERVDVVLTVGRSGHRAADFAPETTAALLERELPGVGERLRLGGPRRPAALLFRGRAGVRRGSVLINLPDDPRAVRELLGFLAPVLPHALAKMHGDDTECAPARGKR